MKTYITRIPLLNLILGILLIVLAIIAMFPTDLIGEAVVFIIAFFIAAFSTLRFLKDYHKTDDKNASIILAVEYVITLAVAVYLAVYYETANPARMVGLVLYLRGFTYLLTLQLLRIKGPFVSFLVYIVILTLGAFMLFAGTEIQEYLHYAVFGIIAIYGLVLLFAGLQGLKEAKAKGSKKPAESKNEPQSSDHS